MNISQRRFDKIWQLRNAGQTHAQVARRLGITTGRVRELIHESMHDRDTAVLGPADGPERFWRVERFGS